MVYVSASDDAWDHERINREHRLIRGEEKPAEGEVIPWQSEDDHPVKRYVSGSARFDLATVRDYFKPDTKPVEFKLRRVGFPYPWTSIQDYIERGKLVDARVQAIAHTLASIDGVDFDFKRKKPSDPLDDDGLERLRDLIGDREFTMLGFACINANAALTSAEKK